MRLLITLISIMLYVSSFAQVEIRSKKIHNKSNDFITQEINEYELVQLDLSEIHRFIDQDKRNFQLTLPSINGEQVNVELTNNNLIAADAQLTISSESGIEYRKIPTNMCYSGHVAGDWDRPAQVFIHDYFFTASFQDGRGNVYIQPANKFDASLEKDIFVIYHDDNVKPHEGTCGSHHDHGAHDHGSQDYHASSRYQTGGCLRTELAIAADYQLYLDEGMPGGDTIADAMNHIISILNDVAANWAYNANGSNFNDGVEFEIVEIWLSTCAACDPWSSSTDIYVILPEFRSWAPSGFNKTHDVGQMWSGKNFDGSTIGLAYVNAVCYSARYHVNENFSNSAANLRVLTSHEMGHNFAARHDPIDTISIMRPSLTVTNYWSDYSQTNINNGLQGYNCLDDCVTITCAPIADINVSNISATGFNVNYAASSSGYYRIRIREAGATSFFYTLSTSSNNLTVTPPGWSACTVYEVLIENDCGSGNYSNPRTAVIRYEDGCPSDNCNGTDLVLNGTISDGVYKAFNTITSTGTIPINGMVIFQAGNEITLNPNFEVLLQADFEARIDTCVTN